MNRVSVTVEKKVSVEKYYVLRGINVGKNGVKTVIEEREIEVNPFYSFEKEVAQMLVDNPDVTFCTIAENYRLTPTDIPFM